MADFHYDGHRVAYTSYGEGDRATVLLPGLLLSQKIQQPLARELVARGNRVITMDPLGHGASDRPEERWQYSMLDGAILAASAAFTPLLFALQFGAPAMRAVAGVARKVPRAPMPFLAQIGVDWISQDPGPSASVLAGILYGRVAPDHKERRDMQTPALVIGHPRDPLHRLSDAGMLVSELPNGRLIDATSILELRVNPERLTGEIAAFIEECWDAPSASDERNRAASA